MKTLKAMLKFLWLYNKVLAGIFFVGMAFIYSLKIEPDWIQIKKQTIYIAGLPRDFESFRIVQLSDLHGKHFTDKALVTTVNKLKPDLIAITGDVFDDESIMSDYAEKVFGGMNPTYGSFFVFGNNDSYFHRDKIIEKLNNIGFITLINKNRKISINNQELWIIGVDDPVKGKDNLTEALKGIEAGPKILLAHSPEIINKAAQKRIDLVLAGHTHGGQINIPFLFRFLPQIKKPYRKYISGFFNVESTQMYVNKGLGVSNIPMRFLVRPEITVITLHSK